MSTQVARNNRLRANNAKRGLVRVETFVPKHRKQFFLDLAAKERREHKEAQHVSDG